MSTYQSRMTSCRRKRRIPRNRRCRMSRKTERIGKKKMMDILEKWKIMKRMKILKRSIEVYSKHCHLLFLTVHILIIAFIALEGGISLWESGGDLAFAHRDTLFTTALR